ncbi:hypothetical protein GGF43_006112, partial [Coemansia sp. RSA 2618]
MKLSFALLTVALAPFVAAAPQVATPRTPSGGSYSLSYSDIQKLVSNDQLARGAAWDNYKKLDSSVAILKKAGPAAQSVLNKHYSARNALKNAFELVKQAHESLNL